MVTLANDEATLAQCDLSHYSALKNRFKVLRTVGQGANGCVVLATDSQNHDIEVAVKVAKKATGGKLKSWVEECRKSKRLHAEACKGTKLQLELVERYIPRCVEVGGTDTAPFIVMHNADGAGIGTFNKVPTGSRLSVFTQAIGALTAMHGLGFSHNDLHKSNVVILSRQPGPLLAFIDFGSTRPLSNGHVEGGYKQDENLPAIWASDLARCPQEAQFPRGKEHISKDQLEERKAAFFACLEKAWGQGEESFGAFVKAFGAVIDEAFNNQQEFIKSKKRPHGPDLVPALFDSEFVQKHHPKPEPFYPSPCGEDDVVPEEHWKADNQHERSVDSHDEPVEQEGESAQQETAESAERSEPSVDPATGNKDSAGADECETACTKCEKKRPMHVCLSGKHAGWCSKHAFKTGGGHHCRSTCTCSSG